MSHHSDLAKALPGRSVPRPPIAASKARDNHYAEGKCLASGHAASVTCRYRSLS